MNAGTAVVGTLTTEPDGVTDPVIAGIIARIRVEWTVVSDPVTKQPTIVMLTETREPVTVKNLPGTADVWGLLDEQGRLLWWEAFRTPVQHGDVFTLLPSPLAH